MLERGAAALPTQGALRARLHRVAHATRRDLLKVDAVVAQRVQSREGPGKLRPQREQYLIEGWPGGHRVVRLGLPRPGTASRSAGGHDHGSLLVAAARSGDGGHV